MIRKVLILISLFGLGGSNAVFAQTETVSATPVSPKSYEITDPVKLFDNLNVLLEKYQLKGQSAQVIQEKLKGKSVYGNLTTDDYFVFKLDYQQEVAVVNLPGSKDSYRAKLYRLIKNGEFPEPLMRFVLGCGGGGGNSGLDDLLSFSPNEFLEENQTAEASDSVWKDSGFHLLTVFAPANRQDYKGFGQSCEEFFIPSPQTHYRLSFVNKQPFPLVKYEEKIFSPKTYRAESVKSMGLVAVENDGYFVGKHIFIVKLVPPFIKSEIFTEQDLIEETPHRAILNKIYVDLAGVWLYNEKTREVISKDVTNIKNTFISERVSKNEPLKILYIPQPSYTEKAREKQVQGIVRLKIKFMASGEIGTIVVIKGLPYGLTNQAVKAARLIKFAPEKKNGVFRTITKTLKFSFFIY